jgi:MFS family permease
MPPPPSFVHELADEAPIGNTKTTMERDTLPLLRNESFRRLLVSRATGQLAQNALLYALLIWVVEKTNSSIHTTLLVAAFTLPSVLVGIPAGTVAESVPTRPLLVLGYVLRAAVVGAILYFRNDIWLVYLLILSFSTVGQFTGPAENAALPVMVEQEQVPAANSFFVLSVMLGQVGGAVILAPFLLKVFGVPMVLAVAAGIFVLAAEAVYGAKGLRRARPVGADRKSQPGMFAALAEGWRVLDSSDKAFMAMVYLTIGATLTRSLAVLAPQYTRDVLGIQVENAVYVMAPAAIGSLLALLLTPLLARLLGASRTAATGFALLLLGFIGLGLVVYVRSFILNHLDLGISFVEAKVGVSSVITIAMILAIPVGLAVTMVIVACKAVLNQEAPAGTQARVFATQSALSDAMSLPPLFAIGTIAQLAGPRAVLLAAAAVGLVAATLLAVSRREKTPARKPRAS